MKKKGLKTLTKVFLVVVLLFVSLYYAYKYSTINNLENRLKTLNDNWVEILQLQEDKNNFLKTIVDLDNKSVQYLDSLKIKIYEYDKGKKNFKECNSDIVYEQYLTNKYMLPLMKFYSDNSMKSEVILKQKKLNGINENIESINKAIDKYNSSVSDYNQYYSRFPNFFIAKSIGLKRKDYFEIKYGVENIDPKIAKKESREWQRKIEMEHGLSE